jgi:hypothetical protein
MNLFATISLISATLFSPLIAVQVQKVLEHRRDRKERRLRIFRVLFTTRATRLAPQHVEALNLIDVEFYERQRDWFRENKSFRKVRSAWRAYLDHLGNSCPEEKQQQAVFLERREDLFIDLLYEMALALGYDDFDKTYIKKQMYLPVAHGELESDQLVIRKSLTSILSGKSPIPIEITDSRASDVQLDQLSIRKGFVDLLSGRSPILVRVVESSTIDNAEKPEAVGTDSLAS